MPRSITSSFRQSSYDDSYDIECEASFLTVANSLADPLDSKKLLKKALQQAGRNPSEKVTSEIWKTHSSIIYYKEYCAILRKLKPLAREDLIRAFKSFDLNGDGYISYSELKKALTSRGEKMTEKEVEKILQNADTNNDGKLDYSEFCTLMLSTSQRCQQNNAKRLAASKKKLIRPSSSKSDSIRPLPRTLSRSNSSISLVKAVRPITPTELDSKLFKFMAMSQDKTASSTPKSLKSWNKSTSKGCFYLDNDNGSILTHEYMLYIPNSSKVWISVKPYLLTEHGDMPRTPIDTSMMLFRMATTQPSKLEFVGIANIRQNFQYCWEGDLRSGSYTILPYTTGCRLFRRMSEPKDSIELIRKDQNNDVQLSKAFTETLYNMFEMCDLDGNGLLNRDEFNWFQLLTSDEEVDDEAWQIVQENFQMKNGELTKDGFLQLHLMQAREENAEPTEEFLDTLLCMGYNKALDLDQACPFEISVHAANCRPSLSVTRLRLGSQYAESETRLTASIMEAGEKRQVPDIPEVDWYVYRDDGRISFALRNNSRATIETKIKYLNMINCVSGKHKEILPLRLVPNSLRLVDHFMAIDENEEWSFSCSITDSSKTNENQYHRPSSSRPRSAKKKSSLSNLF